MKQLENGLLVFNNGKEMLDEIQCGTDLYNSATGQYVFLYNDSGSIASYTLGYKKVDELREKQGTLGGGWSEYLGIGGWIYDDENDYNLRWCEAMYKGEWEMV